MEEIFDLLELAPQISELLAKTAIGIHVFFLPTTIMSGE
jgi:hypothetical protein